MLSLDIVYRIFFGSFVFFSSSINKIIKEKRKKAFPNK